jgi:hypothetical protein
MDIKQLLLLAGITIRYGFELLVLLCILYAPGRLVYEWLRGGTGKSGAETHLLSIGISFAFAVCTGFLYYLFQIKLPAVLWFSLPLTLIALLFFVVKKGKLPLFLGFKHLCAYLLRINPLSFILWGITACLVASAFIVAFFFNLSGPAQSSFTQLWILPDSSRRSFSVGIQNQERVAKIYRLEVKGNGENLAEWQEIQLKPGEIWKQKIDPGSKIPQTDLINIYLYDIEKPAQIFREVHMRIGQP